VSPDVNLMNRIKNFGGRSSQKMKEDKTNFLPSIFFLFKIGVCSEWLRSFGQF